MKLENRSTAGSTTFLIIGWTLSAIPILMMGVGGVVFGLFSPQTVHQGMIAHGYPDRVTPIIIALEIGCAVIYAIPQTAVLGAILMTGYLGGATATHVRVEENQWVMPVLFGILVWLGLFLRDQRLRRLLPIRKSSAA